MYHFPCRQQRFFCDVQFKNSFLYIFISTRQKYFINFNLTPLNTFFYSVFIAGSKKTQRWENSSLCWNACAPLKNVFLIAWDFIFSIHGIFLSYWIIFLISTNGRKSSKERKYMTWEKIDALIQILATSTNILIKPAHFVFEILQRNSRSRDKWRSWKRQSSIQRRSGKRLLPHITWWSHKTVR